MTKNYFKMTLILVLFRTCTCPSEAVNMLLSVLKDLKDYPKILPLAGLVYAFSESVVVLGCVISGEHIIRTGIEMADERQRKIDAKCQNITLKLQNLDKEIQNFQTKMDARIKLITEEFNDNSNLDKKQIMFSIRKSIKPHQLSSLSNKKIEKKKLTIKVLARYKQRLDKNMISTRVQDLESLTPMRFLFFGGHIQDEDIEKIKVLEASIKEEIAALNGNIEACKKTLDAKCNLDNMAMTNSAINMLADSQDILKSVISESAIYLLI